MSEAQNFRALLHQWVAVTKGALFLEQMLLDFVDGSGDVSRLETNAEVSIRDTDFPDATRKRVADLMRGRAWDLAGKLNSKHRVLMREIIAAANPTE